MYQQRKTVIYGLTDPRTEEVLYVGKTQKPLEIRLAKHVEDTRSRRYRHLPKSVWIADLKSLGLTPGIIVLEEVQKGQFWEDAERKWIVHYFGIVGSRLLNCTRGGQGVVGYRHTEATIARMSLLAKQRKPKPLSAEARARIGAATSKRLKSGKLSPKETEQREKFLRSGWQSPMTDERRRAIGEKNRDNLTGRSLPDVVRQKVSAAMKGRPKSEETRRRMSAAQKGRTFSPEHRAKIAATLKRRFEEEPEFAASFKAARKAAGANTAAKRRTAKEQARG